MIRDRLRQFALPFALIAVCVLPSAGRARADSFDWRNVDGKNYMTPSKPQGPLECQFFGSIAAFEAKIKIAMDDPDIDIDLSERHVLAANLGTFSLFAGAGVLTEAEMPYETVPPVFAPGWEDRTWSITEYQPMGRITDEDSQRAAIQGWLRDYGPLYTQDYHGNTLVGYDDEAAHWIVKETFGTAYCDNGYGYYDYGYMQGRHVVALTGEVRYGRTEFFGPVSVWQGGTGGWGEAGN